MSDTQTTLAGIVSEAVGPLPRVCAEQVLRDLERARMTAEDFRAGNAACTVYGETFRRRVASQTERIANDRAYMRTLTRRERVLDETIEEHERTLRAVTSQRDWARVHLRGVGHFARLTHAEDALNEIRIVLRLAGEDPTAEEQGGDWLLHRAGEDPTPTAEEQGGEVEMEGGNTDVIMETEGGAVE